LFNLNKDEILEMLNLSTTQHNTTEPTATQHNAVQQNATQQTHPNRTYLNTTKQEIQKSHAHMLNKPVEVTSTSTKNYTEKKGKKCCRYYCQVGTEVLHRFQVSFEFLEALPEIPV